MIVLSCKYWVFDLVQMKFHVSRLWRQSDTLDVYHPTMVKSSNHRPAPSLTKNVDSSCPDWMPYLTCGDLLLFYSTPQFGIMIAGSPLTLLLGLWVLAAKGYDTSSTLVQRACNYKLSSHFLGHWRKQAFQNGFHKFWICNYVNIGYTLWNKDTNGIRISCNRYPKMKLILWTKVKRTRQPLESPHCEPFS